MSQLDEGRDLPQIEGLLTSEALAEVNSAQLIDGKTYTCQRCGRAKVAPDVSRCICGLRICQACAPEHDAGG